MEFANILSVASPVADPAANPIVTPSLSPAHASSPVSPDDVGCFDRTASSSPVCPSETLQQCGVSRIIQIHPTQRDLSSHALIDILEQAAPLGYNVVSLSGGEPFIYSELEELVTASRSLGFFNSVTTNGMLLRSQRAQRILRQLDLVTVSIDGKQKVHDRRRNQEGAFAGMLEGLEVLKDSIEKFGLVHTLLPDSWKILSWLTDFALGHKASLLHLHPAGFSGHTSGYYHSSDYFGEMHFTPTDLYRVFIAHYYLKTFSEPELFIQLDLLHRDHIIGNPNFFFHQSTHPSLAATPCATPDSASRCTAPDSAPPHPTSQAASQPEPSARGFSALFKELIINEKGDILPIAHGCSDYFRIGNINSGQPLEEMITRFMETRLGPIMQLYNDTYREILADTGYDIFNWRERVIENSYSFNEEVPA